MLRIIIGVLLFGFVGFMTFFVGWTIYQIIVSCKKDKIKRLRREEAKKEMYQIRVQKEVEYAEYKNALFQKYGEPNKIIRYGQSVAGEIIVFAESSIVVIESKEYSFNDIISCTLIDNNKVVKGEMNATIETSTDTDSLIGRGVVGGLVAGPVGAIIGSSTASKTSSVNCICEDDKMVHSYNLIIGVRSFENPIIKIWVGNQQYIALEIEAIFRIIISENNKITV